MKLIKENRFFLIVLGTILLIHFFVVSPVRVSGSSMEQTLHDFDRGLILKPGKVERFDIIVFEHFKDGKKVKYIKRVIGLPGETVELEHQNLFIDGEKMEQNFSLNNPSATGKFIYKVPTDEYFVLGDNRSNSTDSRMIGGIKHDKVIGRFIFRFYPFNTIRSF